MVPKANSPISLPLRLWFDDARQLQPHFHERHGRHLVFFPQTVLHAGLNVLLEVGLRSNDQTCVLRGQVVAIEEGETRGSWLSFPERAQIGGLAEAAAARRRRSRRLPMELAATARARTIAQMCRVIDVSVTGARLTGLAGVARLGSDFDLSLFNRPSPGGEIGSAIVVWQNGLETGVRFQGGPAARHAVGRLVSEASGAWTGAIEARHASACTCVRGGDTTDPEPPEISVSGHSRPPPAHDKPKFGPFALLKRMVSSGR